MELASWISRMIGQALLVNFWVENNAIKKMKKAPLLWLLKGLEARIVEKVKMLTAEV